MSYLDVN